MAAVVEPEGRKAYWSENERLGGSFRKAGYKKERTTARSIILVSISVIEIVANWPFAQTTHVAVSSISTTLYHCYFAFCQSSLNEYE